MTERKSKNESPLKHESLRRRSDFKRAGLEVSNGASGVLSFRANRAKQIAKLDTRMHNRLASYILPITPDKVDIYVEESVRSAIIAVLTMVRAPMNKKRRAGNHRSAWVDQHQRSSGELTPYVWLPLGGRGPCFQSLGP